MLNEKQLSELMNSIALRIGVNSKYLPIIGERNKYGLPHILLTKTGYTFRLEENECVIFEEIDLDLDTLIYRVFRLISYDMFSENFRKIRGENSLDDSVSLQREKRFNFQIDLLGRINQYCLIKISEEINNIRKLYPLNENGLDMH